MNNEDCGKVTCCATCSRKHTAECAECFKDRGDINDTMEKNKAEDTG